MKAEIAQLVALLAQGKGAKFGSLTYTAKGTGETARHTLILGFNRETLYEKDIAILSDLLPTVEGLKQEAVAAILKSRQTSLAVGIGNNPDYTCAGLYVEPEGLNGIKVHIINGSLHVCGLQESKVVLTPGTYKKVNSAALTLAKREIEKLLPSTRFRQYRLDRVTLAKMNGETLELEGVAAME